MSVKFSSLFQAFFCLFLFFFLFGCANQKPPGGGEEDKESPKIVNSYPKPGTVNFNDNRITIELSEYVDRRSFQDAFRISPPIPGDITFDWGGKEVEIIFPKPLSKLYPDKTFLVNLNSNLKDLHGNSLARPLTLAFSTGSKIDKAEISGRVFNNDQKITTILAYNIEEGEKNYNPVSKLADYITETSADGDYALHNLARGKYRIIAIVDDDKNMYYTVSRENFSVLSGDVILTDSLKLENMDFYMPVSSATQTGLDLNYFFKDSLDIIYSSVENNSHNVFPEQSIQFYFKNYAPLHSEVESSFQLKDAQNNSLKTVFNWRNDSLLESFPALNFQPAADYALSFSLTLKDGKMYHYKINFKTASSNSFGDISGTIKLSAQYLELVPVVIRLESKDTKPPIVYLFHVQDTSFLFKKILENDYTLFSFIDNNGNSIYDFGNPFPFEYSEKFFIYPQTIKVKGGWSVENIIIDFSK